MPSAEWRRWRSWKIPRYLKVALANSMRVLYRMRLRNSVIILPQNISVIALSQQSPIDSIDGRQAISVDDVAFALWVDLEGNDLSLVRWNHRPALVRAALQRFGGRADWKPRWYLLAVPTESFVGSARSVFSLAAPDEWRDCRGIHRADSGCPPPRSRTPAWQRYVDKIWAARQARNAGVATRSTTAISPRFGWLIGTRTAEKAKQVTTPRVARTALPVLVRRVKSR
jgi:hypothetical protein